MNYIGSKLSLLPFLDASIHTIVDSSCVTFCDLFAGTGAVGRYFKTKGYQIIANDLQHYSFVLNRHYVGNSKELTFVKLFEEIPKIKREPPSQRKQFVCQYLNNIKPIDTGFIFNNYCYGGTKQKEHIRQYFTDENGMRCDAIRSQIEAWHQDKKINNDEYYFLLASLLENIDKVANTASVYGAFLKKIKPSAAKPLELKAADLILSTYKNKVYKGDANNIIKKIKADVLYLDPPYNQRQYAPNYHLLETISCFDNPKINGKTGLREYANQKSDWSSKSKVTQAFKDLVLSAQTKYIFLSYNNEGLLTLDEIKSIMKLRGEYGVFTKKYSRFRADKEKNRNHIANNTTEYLHYVKVKK